MANNYMFLCYKPTGRIIRLAKRMGWGWYDAIDTEKLEIFLGQCEFDATEFHEHQDAFCLLMEDDEGLVDNNKQKFQYDGTKTGRSFDFVKFVDKNISERDKIITDIISKIIDRHKYYDSTKYRESEKETLELSHKINLGDIINFIINKKTLNKNEISSIKILISQMIKHEAWMDLGERRTSPPNW